MNTTSPLTCLAHLISGIAAVALLTTPTPLHAQNPATRPAPSGENTEVRIRETPPRQVRMFAGQSRLLDTPWPVKRVSINNPVIADVDVASPRRVQLVAKSPGTTEVTMWSETGQAWQAMLEVDADSHRLQTQLREMFPKSTLEVSHMGNVVVLKGVLPRAEQVPQLRRFMELANIEFLDTTTVAGVQQVQLQVRVAEVSRTALRALGFNAFVGGQDFFGGLQLGSSSAPFVPMNVGVPQNGTVTGNVPFQANTAFGTPASATLFGGFPGSDLQIFVQALAENQYMRILAEPTLVALSGSEANFLAGGEFPIPIAQLGGGGTTQISIEYKEFGVRLRFQPIVLGDGKIHLHVIPEISQLSDVGSVEVFGTHVPSVLTRRLETTLQLYSGQTFAIAGLINRTDDARNSRIPGLGDLPVLGALFRSIRYNRSETEMLVMVTASIVEPASTERVQPMPGSSHEPPNDWEFYGEGRLSSKAPAPLAPVHAEQIKRMGLTSLQGPGGWVSYDQPSNKLAGDGGVTAVR